MAQRQRTLAKKVALHLLRWYPRPWRDRYLVEMRALLEEIPVGWAQTANIAAIAAREWLSPRAFGWPARTAAERLVKARAFKFAAVALMMDGVAKLIGSRLRTADAQFVDSLETASAILLGVVFVRWLAVLGKTLQGRNLRSRQWLRKVGRWRRPFMTWEIAVGAVALFPLLVHHHATFPQAWMSSFTRAVDPYMHIFQMFMYASFMHRASYRTWRLRRVAESRKTSWRPRWIDPGDDLEHLNER